MIRLIGVFLCAFILAGCKELAWGPYVSPRVAGRVLAADTRQPLAGVKVTRGRPEPPLRAGWAPHGGELLVRKLPISTGPNGQFVMESERVLTLVRWGGWSSVHLNFDRAGYLRLQTNFPISSLTVTNAPDGVPLLDAGQVLLQKPAAQHRPRRDN
jgi:hypothetical protein